MVSVGRQKRRLKTKEEMSSSPSSSTPPMADFAAQNCLRPIGTRWIYTNKGKAKNVAVFRHGDDFVVCGTRTQQAEFKSELGQYFVVKQLAILGPSPALGDVPEVRILNRLVRWV